MTLGFFFPFLFSLSRLVGEEGPQVRAEVAHEDGASSRRHQALHKPPPRFPPPFVRLHNVTPSAICLWLPGADDSFVQYIRLYRTKVQLYL